MSQVKQKEIYDARACFIALVLVHALPANAPNAATAEK